MDRAGNAAVARLVSTGEPLTNEPPASVSAPRLPIIASGPCPRRSCTMAPPIGSPLATSMTLASPTSSFATNSRHTSRLFAV